MRCHLIFVTLLMTSVLSCNHHHHKEKYGHSGSFGPRFRDYVHSEHHHTHFHGDVAIINTAHPNGATINQIASSVPTKDVLVKQSPSVSQTSTVSHGPTINQQFFQPDNNVVSVSRSREQVQYRNQDKQSGNRSPPLVDVPFSIQIINGYMS